MPQQLKQTAIKLIRVDPFVFKPRIAGGKISTKMLSVSEMISGIDACSKCAFGKRIYDSDVKRCKIEDSYNIYSHERLLCHNRDRDIYFKFEQGKSEVVYPRKKLSWKNDKQDTEKEEI